MFLLMHNWEHSSGVDRRKEVLSGVCKLVHLYFRVFSWLATFGVIIWKMNTNIDEANIREAC